jgi:hypothetical protein
MDFPERGMAANAMIFKSLNGATRELSVYNPIKIVLSSRSHYRAKD